MAAEPETAGAAWLVPEDDVYHCWPTGKKLMPTPPQTPAPSKQVSGAPIPLPAGLASADWATPAVMCVPGARISGFLRPSDVGPRDENVLISLALSAAASVMP